MTTISQLTPEVKSLLRTGVAITSVTQGIEELILNAVDAGATCVAVRADMTCYKFQVIDNGVGMSEEQLGFIGQRYSTSKCHTVGDLDNLCYFGYRGEAIASLKDVTSVLEIVSRTKMSTQTYCKMFQKGRPLSVTESAFSRPSAGTTVTVHDLFYNLPVRRNAINIALEMENIKKRIEAIALIRPGVSVTLRNDVGGNVILQTQKTNSIINTFTSLFGVSRSKFMSKVQRENPPYTVTGYIGKEGFCKKDCQFVYINGRLVLKTKIHKHINNLLKKSLILKRRNASDNSTQDNSPSITSSPTKHMVKRHGVYIIDIKCPYSLYDITFEPAKTLVEFRHWDPVLVCIEETVQEFLKRESLQLGLQGVDKSPVSNTGKVDLEETEERSMEKYENDSNSGNTEVDRNSEVSENDKENGDESSESLGKSYARGISTQNTKYGLTSQWAKRAVQKSSNSKTLHVDSSDLAERNGNSEIEESENTLANESESVINQTDDCDDQCGNQVMTDSQDLQDNFQTPITYATQPRQVPVIQHRSRNSTSTSGLSSGDESPRIVSETDTITEESEEPVPSEKSKTTSTNCPSAGNILENKNKRDLIRLKTPKVLSDSYSSLSSLRASNSNGHKNGKAPVNKLLERINALKKKKSVSSHAAGCSDSGDFVNDSLSRLKKEFRKKESSKPLLKKTSVDDDVEGITEERIEKQPVNGESRQRKESEYTALRKINMPKESTLPNPVRLEAPKMKKTIQISKAISDSDAIMEEEREIEKPYKGDKCVTDSMRDSNLLSTDETCMTNIIGKGKDSDTSELTSKVVKRPGGSLASKLSKQIRKQPSDSTTAKEDDGFQAKGFRVCRDVVRQGRECEEKHDFDFLGKRGLEETGEEIDTYRNIGFESDQNFGNIKRTKLAKTIDSGSDLFQTTDQNSDIFSFTGLKERKKTVDSFENAEENKNNSSSTDRIPGQRQFMTTESLLQTGQSLIDSRSHDITDRYGHNLTDRYRPFELFNRKSDRSNDFMNRSEFEVRDVSALELFSVSANETGDKKSNEIKYLSDSGNDSYHRPSDLLQKNLVYDDQRNFSDNLLSFRASTSQDSESQSSGTPHQDYSVEFYGTPLDKPHTVTTSDAEMSTQRQQSPELDLVCYEKIEDFPLEVPATPEISSLCTYGRSSSQGFVPSYVSSELGSQGFTVYPFHSDQYRLSPTGMPGDKLQSGRSVSCVSPAGSEGFSPVMAVDEDEDLNIDNSSANIPSSDYKKDDVLVMSGADKVLHSPVNVSELFDTLVTNDNKNHGNTVTNDSIDNNVCVPNDNNQNNSKRGNIEQDRVYNDEGVSFSENFQDVNEIGMPQLQNQQSFPQNSDCTNEMPELQHQSLDSEIYSEPGNEMDIKRNFESKSNIELNEHNDNSIEDEEISQDLFDASEKSITSESTGNEATKFKDRTVDGSSKDEDLDESGVMSGNVDVPRKDEDMDKLDVLLQNVDVPRKDKGTDELNVMSQSVDVPRKDEDKDELDIMSQRMDVPRKNEGMNKLDVMSQCVDVPRKDEDMDELNVMSHSVDVSRKDKDMDELDVQSVDVSRKDEGMDELDVVSQSPDVPKKDENTCTDELDVMSQSGEEMLMVVADAAEATFICNNDKDSPDAAMIDKELDQSDNKTCVECKQSNTDLPTHSQDVSEYIDEDDLSSIKWKDKQQDRPNESLKDNQRKSVDDLFEEWKNPVFERPEQEVLSAEVVSSTRCDASASKVLYPQKFTKGMLKHVRVLGQVDNKFISCILPTKEFNDTADADPGLIVMIDQHAAHERVRLEQLTAAAYCCVDDDGVERIVGAPVVPPEPVVLPEDEVRIMMSFQEEFTRIGIKFTADNERRNQIFLGTVPACIVTKEAKELTRNGDPILFDIVESVIKEHTEFLRSTKGCLGALPRILHKCLCSQACRGAIKFGDSLSLSECEQLLESLNQCKLPFQCAHGRPSVVPLLNLDKVQDKCEFKKAKVWKISRKLRQMEKI